MRHNKHCCPMGPRRPNGCVRPFSTSQLAAWFGQPLVLAWFAAWFGVLGWALDGDATAFVIAVSVLWAGLTAMGIVLWITCQVLDTSVTSQDVRVSCIPTATLESRYCAVCKKTVPGLDHHCDWLGTCVGTRTYLSFFLLVLTSAMLYWLQCIVFAIMMASTGIRQTYNDVMVYVVCAIGIFFSFPIAGFHTLLFMFHVYLQMKKLTTYGWFLQQDKARREAKKKAKEAAGTMGVPTPMSSKTGKEQLDNS